MQAVQSAGGNIHIGIGDAHETAIVAVDGRKVILANDILATGVTAHRSIRAERIHIQALVGNIGGAGDEVAGPESRCSFVVSGYRAMLPNKFRYISISNVNVRVNIIL